MSKITVAATQMACSWDREENIDKAERIIREAANSGAQIIQIQELFETPYFPQTEDYGYLDLARSSEDNPMLERMKKLADELSVVLPMSFFEEAGPVRFNTIAVIDADGTILGYYRKTHIPDDMGYYEKFYFTPGDTGFKVWETKYAKIGIGVCWDQWFPEAARIMALQGADFISYPTAIGTFAMPIDADADTADPNDEKWLTHWQNVMLGHAAANMTPIIASNRVGIEKEPKSQTKIKFWGSSFIGDECGNKVAEMDGSTEGTVTSTFDMEDLRYYRNEVCVFRDRRPDMYDSILSLDGK